MSTRITPLRPDHSKYFFHHPPTAYRLPTTRHDDLLTSQTQTKSFNHSWIFARISESRNKWYSYTSNTSQQTTSQLHHPQKSASHPTATRRNPTQIKPKQEKREKKTLTSSPTLIGFPPHPGSRTRSPGFTDVGTTLPSLSGAPGPTAITVASGSGVLVVDDGRKMPVAVFWSTG